MSKIRLPKEYLLEKPGSYDENFVIKHIMSVLRDCSISTFIKTIHSAPLPYVSPGEHLDVFFDIAQYVHDVSPNLSKDQFLKEFKRALFYAGFFD